MGKTLKFGTFHESWKQDQLLILKRGGTDP
jgi:hypothetical protein